jgi:hypothetical protein
MNSALSQSLLIAGSILLALSACSSGDVTLEPRGDGGDTGDATNATSDGGNDASTGPADAQGQDDVSSDAPRATACTAPPFVAFTAHMREITTSKSDQALAGATVGFTTCAGFVVTTDANGVAATNVTKGIAYSPFYSSNGHVNAVGAEAPATSDADVTVTLPIVNESGIIPGYDASKPSLEIVLVAKGTPPCDGVDGVTLEVTNHPEGIAKYMATDWPTNRTPVGTASSGDHVFFTGLAAGIKVQVTGKKTGCTVTTVTSAQTGNFELVNGLLTIGEAVITN